MAVWNSSEHTRHLIFPHLNNLDIATTQLFLWLQNGQLNSLSKGTIVFFFGGRFLFDLPGPIAGFYYFADLVLRRKVKENTYFLLFRTYCSLLLIFPETRF